MTTSQITLTLNASGNPRTITDASGRMIALTYDSYPKIATMSDSLGTIATYVHAFMGTRTSVTYADGSKFTFTDVFSSDNVNFLQHYRIFSQTSFCAKNEFAGIRCKNDLDLKKPAVEETVMGKETKADTRFKPGNKQELKELISAQESPIRRYIKY